MTRGKHSGTSSQIFQHFESRQAPRCAHNATAGMRGRTTHVEILDGRAEARVSWRWTQEEKLLQRKFSLEDVAFAQSPLAFEVEGSDDLLVEDDVFDIGRVLGDGVDDGIAEGLLLVVPVETRSQLVGCVLDEAREHVLARRGDGR